MPNLWIDLWKREIQFWVPNLETKLPELQNCRLALALHRCAHFYYVWTKGTTTSQGTKVHGLRTPNEAFFHWNPELFHRLKIGIIFLENNSLKKYEKVLYFLTQLLLIHFFENFDLLSTLFSKDVLNFCQLFC